MLTQEEEGSFNKLSLRCPRTLGVLVNKDNLGQQPINHVINQSIDNYITIDNLNLLIYQYNAK